MHAQLWWCAGAIVVTAYFEPRGRDGAVRWAPFRCITSPEYPRRKCTGPTQIGVITICSLIFPPNEGWLLTTGQNCPHIYQSSSDSVPTCRSFDLISRNSDERRWEKRSTTKVFVTLTKSVESTPLMVSMVVMHVHQFVMYVHQSVFTNLDNGLMRWPIHADVGVFSMMRVWQKESKRIKTPWCQGCIVFYFGS